MTKTFLQFFLSFLFWAALRLPLPTKNHFFCVYHYLYFPSMDISFQGTMTNGAFQIILILQIQ